MHRLPKVLTALSAALFLGLAGCNPPSLSDTETHCGNGVIDPGETCDDGNTVNGDGCSSACWSTYKATCGDGKKEQKEECDDGDTDDTNACKNDCTPNAEAAGVCGDGAVTGAELCDDGNTNGGDGCPATCGYVTSATECVASSDTTGTPCPVTLQTLKASITGVPPAASPSSPFTGKKVSVPNVLVVGRSRTGNPPSDVSGFFAYDGPQTGGGAGIMVFVGTGNGAGPRVIGERIDIASATVAFFSNQMQLTGSGGTSLSIKSKSLDNPLPPYVTVSPADIRAGGARSLELNGQLVEVSNAVVTSANPDGSSDFNEFVVDTSASDPATAGVRVDDASYSYPLTTTRVVGKRFGAVRGVLAYANGNPKILPQKEGDLTAPGVPSITLSPAEGNFARVAATPAAAPTVSRTTPLTVTLSGVHFEAVQVSLSSSDPTKLTVPATVSIPAGETTAQVPVTALAAAETVTVSATVGQVTRTATVRVLATTEGAGLLNIRAVTQNGQTDEVQSTVTSGTLKYAVNLDAPALAGTSVALAVDPAELGTVPATLTIPTDAFSAEFTFTAAANPSAESGRVTATLGANTVQANLNVVNPATVQSLTSAATTVGGNASLGFTVTLNKVTPVSVQVAIASTNGIFPATNVEVPANQSSATFNLKATDVRTETTGNVTATLGTSSATVTGIVVTVVAPVWTDMTVPPQLFTGRGGSATVVFDKGSHGAASFNVALEPISPDVTVPAGLTLSSSTLTVADGATSGAVTILVAPETVTSVVRARVSVTPAAGGTARTKDFAAMPRVVISELALGGWPTGATAVNHDDEFVELYNPNPVDVDVSGYRVQYKGATTATWSTTSGYTLPAGTTIKAHGYLLLGSTVYGTAGNGPAADLTYPSTALGAFSGSSGNLRLVGPTFTTEVPSIGVGTLDRIAWGTTANDPETTRVPAIADLHATYERKAYATSTVETMTGTGADAGKGNGHDTDNNQQDFIERPQRNPQNALSAVTEVP